MNPTSNKSDFEDLTTNLKDLAYSYLEKYSPSKQQLKVYLLKKYLTKIKGGKSKKEVSLIIDQMKEKGSGKIINIGSMFSIFGGAHASVYAASKGGVVQYTKSCAVAWIKYGIQVNAILPGYITTNLTDGFKEFFPEEANLVTTRIPAGRWGVPNDLAGTAIYLASPASDYVTGTFIPVDGGYSIR